MEIIEYLRRKITTSSSEKKRVGFCDELEIVSPDGKRKFYLKCTTDLDEPIYLDIYLSAKTGRGWPY